MTTPPATSSSAVGNGGLADAPEQSEPARPPASRRSAAGRTSARLSGYWEQVPLRPRLVGILVVLLVIALTATGWGAQFVLKDFLYDQRDGQLLETAQRVQRDLVTNRDPLSNKGLGPILAIQFNYDDGRTPGRSPLDDLEADNRPKIPVLTHEAAKARADQAFDVGSVGSSLKWRVMVFPVTYVEGGERTPGSVAVALPIDDIQAAVQRLRLFVVLFGLVVTVTCVMLGWVAIRRAFVPLAEVETTAAAIAKGDLSRRVPSYPATTEVGRLTSALNGMLAQIENAFRARAASENRTRRFAADASHELRTPLAAIRGFAELYRQGAVRDPDDVARTMDRIEREAKRMGVLVEDLLLLARLDERRPARSEPVDLAVIAGDATHDALGLAPDRTVRLVGVLPGRGPEPSVVIGDENRLRQVVANLLGNAVRHTPQGTPIEVAVGRAGGQAILEVRDHGPGIPPDHAAKVFERFYRVDASRTRTQGGGSGLGLSIVAAVVAAHGGRVGVAPTPGGGATFRVELPVSQDKQVAPEPEDAGPTA
jgi:two-component system OmpR family sensor kinase